MQRNSNGVEPGAMQEREIFPRDVAIAILLPECRRPFRSKQLQNQSADLARRLRAGLEQPHITFWHHPIDQVCSAKKERFAGRIDNLLVSVWAYCALPSKFHARERSDSRTSLN